MNKIQFGREICGNLDIAETKEWLVTNGIGGYASGTIAGLLTRRYHGLLVAALKPPVQKYLLATKLDETISYLNRVYYLYTNRWARGIVEPDGYLNIQSFHLEGTTPVWRYAFSDVLLEKRVWMQPSENTTYIYYSLIRASSALQISLKALVNYRDHHSETYNRDWQMQIFPVTKGVCVSAYKEATNFYLFSDKGNITFNHDWYLGFDLATERYRGFLGREDHLHVATISAKLEVGESLTIVATTSNQPNLDGSESLLNRHNYEQKLIDKIPTAKQPHLILAADQFIVNRPTKDKPEGKSIIAGYHWFNDWGRDTMISLTGLTICTGRPEIARLIIRTFADYIDKGMLPNVFPDVGETPEYNTVDAILWYFAAIRAYYQATGDKDLIKELFPYLAEVIEWHRRGTRYNIHLDHSDGLIYAGQKGVQLTWMDAKIGDWVVTPRIGKPVEINALWYNALTIMVAFAKLLNLPYQEYETMAQKAAKGFQRFWNPNLGYCYDVIDTDNGHDTSLRPNQIFAVSLPSVPVLLTQAQQKSVVDIVSQTLLTSHGLRSLAPNHPQYSGYYGGDRWQRDAVYHQGTVWGWLIGAYIEAYLRVYQNPSQAIKILEPMSDHLLAHGVGSLSEIFDGNAPFTPRGCIAQAWTVAEVLRAYWLINNIS